MACWPLTITCKAANGATLDHLLRFTATSPQESIVNATAIVDAYQPLTNCQVSAARVDNTQIPFTPLRGTPAGVLQNRLFLCFFTTPTPETPNRGRLQFAISDPVVDVAQFILTKGASKPASWADFEVLLSTIICNVSGQHAAELNNASLRQSPVAADGGEPIQQFSGTPRETMSAFHAATHRKDGNDPIIYQRTQWKGGGELFNSGAINATDTVLSGYDMSRTGDSSELVLFDLSDYAGGDVTVLVMYKQLLSTTGDIVLKLDSLPIVHGSGLNPTRAQTRQVTPPTGVNISIDSGFTIPEADFQDPVALGLRLHRMGADAADNNDGITRFFGVGVLYSAFLL